jgi:hypothetical protein
MANEVTYSGLETGGLRVDKVITAEVHMLLKDSASLRNTPYFINAGSINGTGTDTLRYRLAGLGGYDSFTSRTEIQAATNTDLSKAFVDIAVSRASLQRDISDLASLTAYGQSVVDPFVLASDMVQSYEKYFAELTGATIQNFTTVLGDATAAFDLNAVFEGIAHLQSAANPAGEQAGSAGPFVCVLSPEAWNDLQSDLQGQTNTFFAYNTADHEMLKIKGENYVGNFLGIDFYKSAHVDSAASAWQNGMWSRGALAYATGVPQNLIGAAAQQNLGEVVVEMSRVSDQAISRITGHCYLGMAVVDDARGCILRSIDN